MRYFDYERIAQEAGISPDKMAKLITIIRQEFPKDDLMFELHVLRACMAIREGRLGIDEALKSAPSE